ncbi:hypothetical protein BKM78_13095 [Tessaracoccus sp. T2.5-30]|nr:hypothetical protein BKM78_13095 [Tessaracoccus sp. T2.5-30]
MQIVRRYWRSTLATVFLAIALAAGFTVLQSPTYTATSSVFISVESGGTAGELSQGATYAERQVGSFITVATSAMVLQPVIDELGLDLSVMELAEKLSVSSPSETSIIEVAADDESAQLAADLSNAVAASLQRSTEELAPPGPDGTRLVSATIIDQAVVPAAPSAPRPTTNLALGGLLGLLLGFGQAVLRTVLDTRVRTTDDVSDLTDAPVLATIEHHEPSQVANRAATEGGGIQWASAEAYRKLRTSIGFVGLGGERRSSMVITSSVDSEGKTETATNLARVLALAGERVLLIDADLRRPAVGERLRIDSELGLSDVLTGRGSLQDLIIDVAPGYFSVLPAGTVPPNPSELLGSEAMQHLLATVERQYDYVLLDAPPLLPVTDAVILAAQTGGAVLVSRSGTIRRQQMAAAIGMLDAANATILGVVLNDVPASLSSTYGYDYSGEMPRAI